MRIYKNLIFPRDCKVFMPTSTPGEYQFYNMQDASDRPRILTATPQRPRVFAAGPSNPSNVMWVFFWIFEIVNSLIDFFRQLRMSQSSPQLTIPAGKSVVKQNVTTHRTTCYTPVGRPATPPRANSPRQYPKSPQRPPRPVSVQIIRPSSQVVLSQRVNFNDF